MILIRKYSVYTIRARFLILESSYKHLLAIYY